MRLVAATFADEAAAEQVLAELRERYELRAIDADVAPLGSSEESGGRVVLAGRFRETVLAEVEQLIERWGGAIVTEVDENKAEHPARSLGEGWHHVESNQRAPRERTSTR